MTQLPAPAPPKGFRPPMPVSVKRDAALIALGLDPANVHFDHDPPLQARVWDPAAKDTIPPANDPHHIVPRVREAHEEKTAKKDIPTIAKIKRVSAEQAAFVVRLLAKQSGEEPPKPKRAKRKIPSRPFPSRKRKGGTRQ